MTLSSSFSSSSSSSSSPRCCSPSSSYTRPSAAHFVSFHGNKLTSKPKLSRPTTLASLRISSPLLSGRAKSRSGAPPQQRSGRFGIWACSQVAADGSGTLSKRFSEFKDSFWRFLRPHTIRGTALGSTALVAKALIENPNLINWWLTIKALYGLIALISGNGYIVGINQIYDIGIDKFQISTLATKLGVRNIALLGSGLLLANYLSAILVAIYVPQAFRRSIMIPSHTLLALGLIFQTWVLEQAKYTKEAISEFYRFIWNLFYAEYIIFPLI